MPIKVLVIDDDVLFTTMFKTSLEREGFEVRVTDSGVAGIQAMQEMEPDIIILDLMIPGKDGWETCREIRTSSQVPILALSAVIDSDMVIRALDEGVTDYLVKPVPPGAIIAHIKRLI